MRPPSAIAARPSGAIRSLRSSNSHCRSCSFRFPDCAESWFGRRVRGEGQGMVVRNGLVAVAAMAIAVGVGFERRSAQSFTTPNACVEVAACAYGCSSVLEQGRTAADFIALAAYQL